MGKQKGSVRTILLNTVAIVVMIFSIVIVGYFVNCACALPGCGY